MNGILAHKRCNKCGETKPAEQFYKHREHKDGLSSSCKSCTDKYNKKWAETNRGKMRGYIKKCMMSNIEKYKEYYRQYRVENRERIRRENREYWSTHKKEKHDYDQAYQKKNADKKRERGRKYRAERPEKNSEYGRNRRARKIANGGVVTAREWQEILDKYDHKCLRCGRGDVKLSMDHIIPLKMGGTHTKDNVQPLCVPCNSWKNARSIDFRPK